MSIKRHELNPDITYSLALIRLYTRHIKKLHPPERCKSGDNGSSDIYKLYGVLEYAKDRFKENLDLEKNNKHEFTLEEFLMHLFNAIKETIKYFKNDEVTKIINSLLWDVNIPNGNASGNIENALENYKWSSNNFKHALKDAIPKLREGNINITGEIKPKDILITLDLKQNEKNKQNKKNQKK